MSNVRWEPVERTGYIDDRGGLLRAHTDDDGTQYIGATSSEITESGWVKMPDKPVKLRLCRAVPAPQWSQEPPTENEAAVWLWHPQFGTAKGIVYWDRGIPGVEITGGPFIECADMPDARYMPATVPQPPGEVGDA